MKTTFVSQCMVYNSISGLVLVLYNNVCMYFATKTVVCVVPDHESRKEKGNAKITLLPDGYSLYDK